MSTLSKSEQKESSPASDEDFENCKGQCGYTPWCRACQEELKKKIHEAERKKMEERESIFDGAR
jgi:hypothetical protein